MLQALELRGTRRAPRSQPRYWAAVRDESFSDPALLLPPEVIAQRIVEDVTTAIEAFAAVAAELGDRSRDDLSGAVDDKGGADPVQALIPEETAG